MHDDHEERLSGGGHDHDHGRVGHNQPAASVAQWQTPHRPESADANVDERAEPADFDLVEQSFIEGFSSASDPTSFLRLASVPFTGADREGRVLNLLRVRLDQVADVGAVTPHLGGKTYRYDPLPAKLVSRRRQLRFVYHDGERLRDLSFAETKGLTSAD